MRSGPSPGINQGRGCVTLPQGFPDVSHLPEKPSGKKGEIKPCASSSGQTLDFALFLLSLKARLTPFWELLL